MGIINWPILRASEGTQTEFVQFWEGLYSGFDEDFYRDNIGRPLTKARIVKWFVWKNGTPLSDRKSQTVQLLATDPSAGHDADAAALTEYLNRPGGVIWRVFWLHLQHPRHFPIYDRYVHRAMAYLLGWPDREIPARNRAKTANYLKSYRPFFDRFEECDPRQVDRALWAFGRFLNSALGKLTTGTLGASR